MDLNQGLLETTLCAAGAESYINVFNKYKIDACDLPELDEHDFIQIGVEDQQIRKKLMQLCKSLPKNEYEEMKMDEEYAQTVLRNVSTHLATLNGVMWSILKKKQIYNAGVKLGPTAKVLVESVKEMNQVIKELEAITCTKKKKKPKGAYAFGALLCIGGAVYIFFTCNKFCKQI